VRGVAVDPRSELTVPPLEQRFRLVARDDLTNGGGPFDNPRMVALRQRYRLFRQQPAHG